jgi:Zn-dependent metalloprotease
MTSRIPLHCILPPHVLEHLAQRGTDAQKRMALHALYMAGQFRGQREAIGALAAGAPSTGGKRRTIYDAKHTEDLPGQLIRSEGGPTTNDAAADEAYDGAGATYDLYHDVFGRNSVDDQGLRLDSTVHYGQDYDNAFWNGRQMVYGDGDGQLFNRFTIAIDVIGHELTHGVTQYEAGLIYSGQPGALNESMSDVFGSLVKQWKLRQSADKADWLIGQGLFTSQVNGVALRSMRAPGTAYDDPVIGKDPQPARMRDYVKTTSDNGGVHINSGIPNHAFYLAATQIGGPAWEKAGKIWYVALTGVLRRRATFQTAANATFQVAGQLYGVGGQEQQAVSRAWAAVDITVK